MLSELPHIHPITIAIWCGDSKPNNLNDYLHQFVDELNNLLANGILINNHKIALRIRCFICDTPARAFLKGKFYIDISVYREICIYIVTQNAHLCIVRIYVLVIGFCRIVLIVKHDRMKSLGTSQS